MHSTTNYSPFEIVYGFNPLTCLDLFPLPINEMVSFDGNRKIQVIKVLHKNVRWRIYIYTRLFFNQMIGFECIYEKKKKDFLNK